MSYFPFVIWSNNFRHKKQKIFKKRFAWKDVIGRGREYIHSLNVFSFFCMPFGGWDQKLYKVRPYY